MVPAKTLHRPGLLRPFGLRRAKVMFLSLPSPFLCTLSNKSAIRKYGTHCNKSLHRPGLLRPLGFAGPKSFFEPSSSIIQNVFALIPIISGANEKRHNKIHTRAKKVMFLPVPPPSLCMLTNKSAVRKYGTCCKQKIRHRTYSEKGRVPFSKRLCPVPEGDRLRRWRL